MNNEKKHEFKLVPNTEIGFLYRKCKKIKPGTISMMNWVPEFNEVIKNYQGGFNDEVVFQLVSIKFNEMYANGEAYRTATRVIKKISREVTGDPNAWKEVSDLDQIDDSVKIDTEIDFFV